MEDRKKRTNRPARPAEAAHLDRLMHELGMIGAGDPGLMLQVRGMMWMAYNEAECPLGPSERAMLVWWTFGQQARLN